MIHFRTIIFDLLDQGKSNEEIRGIIHDQHNMELPIPRINNYRELHERIKLDAVQRQKFLDGKLDLLGTHYEDQESCQGTSVSPDQPSEVPEAHA